MDDAKHEHHLVLVDHVIHHAVVANTEPMERVTDALDRLDRFALDPARSRSILRQPFERLGDPFANLR